MSKNTYMWAAAGKEDTMKKLIFWCSMQGINLYWSTISDKFSWNTLHQRASLYFANLKRGKQSFSHPTPSTQCCATVPATCTKQQPPQHWEEGTGGGSVDCFVLRSYSSWEQCLNNLITNSKMRQIKPGNRDAYFLYGIDWIFFHHRRFP